MKEHKRIEGKFSWVPMDKRTDRLGLPLPPRKPEKRKPKYWLTRDGGDLYFINNTDEILDLVSTATGGFQTSGDDVMTVGGNGYIYDNVMPQEAVKIEEFDGFYDLDFVLQVEIHVKSKKEGSLIIKSPPEKGGIGETILLWDTGEEGKFVSIRKDLNV